MVLPPRQQPSRNVPTLLGVACATACLALLVAPLLLGLPDGMRPSGDAGDAGQAALEAQAAEALRIATGREIIAESLGPRLSALLAPALATSGATQASDPSGLAGMLGVAGADDLVRLPVPQAPEGPEPLLQALQVYGTAIGQALPATDDLRPAITALRFDPEAEVALARLVLAYTQALHLQASATSTLDPLERAVLQGDGQAMVSWSRGKDAGQLDMDLMELAARVDQDQLLQAGDLLARTVEEVRLPLARPALALSQSTTPGAGGADPDPWGTVRAVVSAMRGGAAPPEPEPSGSLDEALRGLLEAYGAPATRLDGTRVTLPASLDQAIASLVDAQAYGVRGGDAGAQASAILTAAEAAEPTLLAWNALLQPSTDHAATDRLALLAALLTPSPSPADLAASSAGVPASALQVRPLAGLLEELGLPADDAARAAASLPPRTAAALAVLLTARADLDRAHAALTQGLPADEAWAITAATPVVAGLLQERTWTRDEAQLVGSWAKGLAAVDPEALRHLLEAQVGAVRATQAAAAILAPSTAPLPASAPVAGIDIPTGVATALAPCVDSDFSKCDEDVYLALDVGGGILVTGEGSTRVDGHFLGGGRHPQITIDLGGNDVYLTPAGAAQVGLGFANVTVSSDTSTISVTPPYNQDFSRTGEAVAGGILGVSIDVGGDDSYTSQAAVAQGAALGLGATGILWDMEGDDLYLQSADEESPVAQVSQGFGGHGGMGLLVDGGGNDTYSALEALAQGVGLAPVFGVGIHATNVQNGVFPGKVGGVGLLLDLGAGSDTLEARAGQGHGDGHSTVGVLLDEQGATSYQVRSMSAAYQGGRGSTLEFGQVGIGGRPDDPSLGISFPGWQLGLAPGGLAALVDLGGDGDSYTTPPFPSASGPIDSNRGMAFLASPGAEGRVKQDNSLWANWTRTASIGIDSSLSDEGDQDGFPALAELLAGSDPRDPDDTPAESLPRQGGTVIAAVQGVIALVEGLDPESFLPPPQPGGTLLDLPLFCPAEDASGCGGDGNSCGDTASYDCISLLFVGDVTATTHDRRALLRLDLGGDDVYIGEVAGASETRVNSTVRHPLTGQYVGLTVQLSSMSLDLEGDDLYDTPGRSGTQAYAAGNSASLLLDLGDGDDRYAAARDSQASNSGSGVAMLVDFNGKDSYAGESGSQAATTGSGWAALLDLGGDDHYRFDTQALSSKTAGGAAALGAIFLDAAGMDHYDSAGKAADLDAEEGATIFATQGRVDPGQGGGQQVAAFLDLGESRDIYETLTVDGGSENVTASKNDVGVHANRPPATADGAVAYFVDGVGALLGDADGVPLLAKIVGFDADLPAGAPPGGSPTSANLTVRPNGELAGRVTQLGYLSLPGMILGSDLDNTYRDYVPFIVDLGGDDHYLAPSIGGTLANYSSRVPHRQLQLGTVAVVLDLKGDDLYRPATCAKEITGSGITMFEGGTNGPHDPYGSGSALTGGATEPPLESPVYTFCPSLGGTASGVAILADGGGTNDFRSSTWINATSTKDAEERTATVAAWGVTQGSAAFTGVGILATWDSRDNFSADLHVRAEEADLEHTPTATANGLAQGAAWGFATGILASFGTQDDDYSSTAFASAPRTIGTDGGLARGLSQGAALGGNGILLDEGGLNTFSAPDGYSQGFASLYEVALASGNMPTVRQNSAPVGILWSGPGDDRYLGGDASQGSAGFGLEGRQSAGVLLDGGGNDIYTIGPAADRFKVRASPCPGPRPVTSAAPQCALSQGAAAGSGLGLLADLAGSDRYEAVGRTHTQSSSLGGTARLIDLGGDDVYLAESRGQAYAELIASGPAPITVPRPNLPAGPIGNTLGPYVPGPTPVRPNPASAVLLDMNGRDAYTLTSAGQGYLPPGSEPTTRAVFIDGGGSDRYRYDGTKTSVAGTPDKGNNWTWSSATPTAGPQNTTGTDTNAVEQALAAYRAATAPTPAGPLADFGTLTLDLARNPDGTSPIGENATVKGPVYALVNVSAQDHLRVQRVDILRDGAFLAVAEPLGADRYLFKWRTVEAGVVDGAARIVATAFLTPANGTGSFAAAPDTYEIESPARSIVVDNPPVASVLLTTVNHANGASPVEGQMAPGRHNASLVVTVGPDSDFPDVPYDDDDLPGAYVNVTLRALTAQPGAPVGTEYNVRREYVFAGTTPILLNGTCPKPSVVTALCPDGRYAVNVTVTDLAGQATSVPEMRLLFDRTPPTSRLAEDLPVLPEYANRTHQAGLFGLNVGWTLADTESGLAPGDVSGIAPYNNAEPELSGITVFRLGAPGEGGAPGEPLAIYHGGITPTSFPFQDPTVKSNDTVYLLTVAQDALGNLESPCKPQETAPCYRTKAEVSGAVKAVLVDFSPPIVRDVELNRSIARPGTSLKVYTNITDTAPLGLRAVELRRFLDDAQLPTIDLGTGPGEARSATFTLPPAEGREQRLYYEVWAQDLARNTNKLGGTIIVDSLRPMLGEPTVAYRDGTTPASAGRPGGEAFISVDVRDREVATVAYTAPSLLVATAKGCTIGDGDAWICTVDIPTGAAAGAHGVTIVAKDAAGNDNQTVVDLDLISAAPEVLNAKVRLIGSDFAEVTWDTDVNATNHLRFGRTGDVRETAGGTQRGFHHVVRVEGLLSGQKYFFRPEPRGLSNVPNTTSDTLQNHTLPGYLLSLPAFDGTVPWSGVRDVLVGVEALGQSRAPVSLDTRLQPASGNGILEGPGLTAAPGVHTLPIDTRAFPDGLYRINLTATRDGADNTHIVSGQFRIDNTAPVLVASTPRPGGVSADARPVVALVVLDPLNPSLPPVDSLSVSLNGAEAKPVNAGYALVNGQRILSFGLERTLSSGHHEITVRLKDAAGNTGEATWGFRTDGKAPDLREAQVAYEPGPTSGRPGGAVQVSIKLADGTGVAGVRVDLGPAGGSPVSLAAMGATGWNGTLRLPAGTPGGQLQLPILAVDGLGNAGQVGLLPIVVDGSAPRMPVLWAAPVNLTAATVNVGTDEPTLVEASAPGGPLAKSAGWEFTHTLTVSGLRPGQVANLTLTAVDGAGNVNRTTLTVALANDTLAPTAPRRLQALSPAEGLVEVSWASSSDNAGVERYEVVRRVGDETLLLPPPNGTAFADHTAPPGRLATYEVTAIDVAGLRGPTASASVKVVALPRLSDPVIEPRSGPSDQPFHVAVEYTHPAGVAPQAILLRYGGQEFPLLRTVPEGDCEISCTYEADLLLPARSTLRAAPVVTILAEVDGEAAVVPLEAPLVTASGDELGVEAGGRDVPGPTVALVALALLAAMRPFRRRPT